MALVVVIEDDDELATTLRDVISDLGHVVASTGVGNEALALVQHHTDLSIIFVDWQLPGGLAGAPLVRELRRLTRVPIIVWSAASGIVSLAAEAGATDFLRKPCSLVELENLLSEYL